MVTFLPDRQAFSPPSMFDVGSGSYLPFYVAEERRAKPNVLLPQDVFGTKRFDPVNIMAIGRRGKGKTAAMTWLAGRQREVIKHMARKGLQAVPNKIASNYWTAYSDMLHTQLVKWINDEGLYSPASSEAYLLVDEIASQVANRRSISRDNLDFGQFLTQLRKRETEMCYTTQFPQWVDMMTLYQTDLFMLMEGKNFDMDGMPTKIKAYVFDYFGQFTGDIRRKSWPPQMEDVDWTWTLLNTANVKGQYNTNQIIPPLWFNKRRTKQIVLSQEDYVIEDKDDSDANEYGWSEGFNQEVVENMRQVPQTLDEFISRQFDFGEQFSLKDTLYRAKRFDDSIKDIASYKAIVEKKGYTVDDSHRVTKG